MALSDITGGSFQLTAGAAIVQDALGRFPLVQIAYDGQAYPVVTSDYAAVANAGQIVAQTTIGTGGLPYINNTTPVIRNADGSFIVAGAWNSNNGLTLYRYSAAGALLNSVILDSGAATEGGVQLMQLTNGNIAVVWDSPVSSKIYFAVYSNILRQVVAATQIDSSTTSACPVSACALTGGGFAVAWYPNSTGLKIAVYANDGSVAKAPTTIVATNVQYNINIAPLSSGGFAVTYYQASAGTYIAAYNANGTQALAPTQVSSYSAGGAYTPRISAMTGFFAIGFISGASAFSAQVYNNAGAQQGTTLALPAASNWITNDGTQFWCSSIAYANPTTFNLISLPTTGAAGAVTYTQTITATGQFSSSSNHYSTYDAVNGNLMFISGASNAYSPVVWVIKTTNPGAFLYAPTAIGSNPTGSGSGWPNILPVGDFSFIAMYDYQNPQSMQFYIGKWANTAIVGEAVTAAAAGAMVSVQPSRIGGGTASYATSNIAGSSPKTFDHTTGAALYGNKGIMMSNGVVLKGM